jgi:hypothetical protein
MGARPDGAIDQRCASTAAARRIFGGVVLAVHDLHHSPPGHDGEVAEHLESAYGGPFFFSIASLREPPGTARIELAHVFRQKDEALLTVLNRVREGDADEDDLAVLNERVHPIRTLSDGEPYVILAPTNAAAGRINKAYLDALPGVGHEYQAGVTGEFSGTAHPTEATLLLKPGAKVMLLRNDPDKRWVNGSIARIARLEDKRVWIEIGGDEHEVEQVSWESRRYAYDKAEEKIVETVAGTFRQFPLRLAWALTIHKSQGLTLDKVYIDLGRGTFAHGFATSPRVAVHWRAGAARQLRPTDILLDRAAMATKCSIRSHEKSLSPYHMEVMASPLCRVGSCRACAMADAKARASSDPAARLSWHRPASASRGMVRQRTPVWRNALKSSDSAGVEIAGTVAGYATLRRPRRGHIRRI